MLTKQKEEKGITLIALVITIIVLLILAAVSIATLTGENGLLTKADDAKENTTIGEEKETIELAYSSKYADKLGGNVTAEELQAELDKSLGNDKTNVSIIDDETLNVLFLETEHNYRVNAGKVTYLGVPPEGVVAMIGSTYYATLQDAINAVPTNNQKTSIVLLTDISENVIISESQDILLNLCQYTISNAEDKPIITVSGTLEIKDGNINGKNYTAKVSSVCVTPMAKLTVTNASINRDSDYEYKWETVEVHGEISVISSKIYSTNSNAICSYVDTTGKIKITGGTITADNYCAISNYVEMEIGGNVEISSSGTAPTIYNQTSGKMKITDGTITADTSSNAINNYGEMEIGGNVEISSNASSYPTVYNQASGKMKITGGTITKKGSGYAVYNNGGEISHTGGTITGQCNF